MARYKVIIAYDGTAFSGMQRQASGRTVQGTVEKALKGLGWSGASILVAGRTDAGVHAEGQVIAFDLDWAHTAEDLQNAMNAVLPDDVAARQVQTAGEDFHPRYDAVARRYRYRVLCQPQRQPLRERYAWRVWPPLELGRLEAASRALRGAHDFAAFGSPPKAEGSTVREVLQAEWRREDEDGFAFEVAANAFLYHMVRRMVGLLVKVGQGGAEAQQVSGALSGANEVVQELAPAHGLTLVAVDYGNNLEGKRLRERT